MSTQDGNVFRFSVSTYHWGHLHPTPWWLRFHSASAEVEASLRRLLGAEVAHLHRSGAGHLYAGLTVPLHLEGDRLIGRLAEQVRVACEVLPARAVQEAPPDEPEESGAPDA